MSEYDDEDFDEDNDPYAYLSHRREENSSNTSLGKPPMHNHSNAREVTSPTSRPQQQQQQHQQEVTTVCCGCRPKATSTKWKRYKKKSRFNIFSSSTQYYDAQEDASPATANAVGRSQAQKQRQKQYEENVSESSMYFFDAVETPLGEDEYPPYFTTSIAHPKPKVSLEDPITLLKHSPTSPVNNDDEIHPQKPISSHKRRSVRWEQITRRPTMEHAQALSSPRVAQDEKGYPGGLTVAELEECQKFLRGLKVLDQGVMDQVYSFRDVEEEPYTICRWLRATKFKADAILQRLEENQPIFERAQKHDFYPNPAQTLGAPVSVFLSQYPFLPIGSAKNGCPVNYFMAGKINPEGILSITTTDRLEGYFWWSFMWKMKDEIRTAQEMDPDFVRMEGINILDLKGLSSSALSSETMEVIKVSSKVADFFPETLHCMLILNAPGFFSFSWAVIKKFLDARTAARIQVFSSEEKGLQALSGLIESSQIPRDFGGGNISIQQAFAKQAADPAVVRQDVELVHVKKGKKIMSKSIWKLEKGEVMTINVYSRSVSGGCVIAYLNDHPLATAEVACNFSQRDEKPRPNCVRLANIKYPGIVTLEVQDLDNASRANSGMSRGYFLIVGDVKKGNGGGNTEGIRI